MDVAQWVIKLSPHGQTQFLRIQLQPARLRARHVLYDKGNNILSIHAHSVLVTWIYASLSIASFHNASTTHCTEAHATSAEHQKTITFTPRDTYTKKPLFVEHTL